MTMSSPATARRSPRDRRPIARRLAAGAAALVALALTVPGAAWADAGTDVDVDGAPDERSITFSMAPSGEGILTAGQPFTVTVAAGNPTDAPAAAGAVELSTSATPLRSRAEVQAWLSGDGADAVRTDVVLTGTELPAISANGRATAAVAVDTASVAGLGPGVYPLSARYASAQGPLEAESVLIVRGTGGTGSSGVIVPITGPAITTGLLTAAQLATLTGEGGDLRGRLDAVAGTGAILAVDPALVAAVRVLGTSAPESATRWLEDLMTLPNARFALQFGDADLAAQVAAGLSTPLSVSTLAPYMSAADFAGGTTTQAATPAATPDDGTTPTPTATAQPGTPVLPTLAELTDIGVAAGAVFWPATGTAGVELVAALAGQAVGDVPSITMVGSDAVASDTALDAWAKSGDARILVYDEDASSALRAAASSDTAVTRAGALAAAAAYAALDAIAAPDAPLLFTVDRSASFSASSLRETLIAADRLTGRPTADLAALTAGEPSPLTLDSVAADPAEVAELTTLLGDESNISSFATILADASLLTAPERASILQLLGNVWADVPAQAQNAYESHRAQTLETLGSVAVQPPSDITLAASSAPLTFSVRNDLPWPVSLVLIATNNDPRLRVQNTTPVDAGPARNTRVKVPVDARVGSGESTLNLQLRSPTMVAVGGSVPVHVSVRAEWESVGLIVGSVLVVAMILAGTIRTVRKLRRGRQADA